MNNQNEHLENLAEMRSLMEKSSRFVSLSGLSGVFAGLAGLIGAGALFWFYGTQYYYPDHSNAVYTGSGEIRDSFIQFLFLDAVGILVMAIGFGVFFTMRKAKRQGSKIWDATSKRLLINLLIPLLTGGVFGLVLIKKGQIQLVAATTLIFYGLALVNASKYTLHDIRYLGICEIILGLLSAFYIGYGLVFWAIGFGLLHVIYGIVMYLKYEN
ncbi:MAG: hypothetical protein ACJAXI_002518 [Crocinitomicaceae bacterium]|jgi:hypothetical protein